MKIKQGVVTIEPITIIAAVIALILGAVIGFCYRKQIAEAKIGVAEKRANDIVAVSYTHLKGAYFVTCTDFVKDENGEITEIHCTYDPLTRSGSGFDGRKVKGTLHWVCACLLYTSRCV